MATATASRYFRPTLYGSGVTLALFAGLFFVIAAGIQVVAPQAPLTIVDFIGHIKPTPVEVIPKRPVRIEPPKAPPMPTTQVEVPSPDVKPVPILIPTLDGDRWGGPTLDPRASGYRDSELIPLVQIRPLYPRQALHDGTEGWVDLQVVVNPDGTVKSARPTAAQPRGVFEAAAVSAMLKSKFKPKVVDGTAVEQNAIQRVEFKMVSED